MVPSDGWRKSSRSGTQGNNCVEARKSAGYFQIRDSKLGDDSPIFDMTPAGFQALMKAAKR